MAKRKNFYFFTHTKNLTFYLFLKDKPEKPTKFDVIFPYVIGIVSLMVCLLFNLLTYLFFPLIFLNGAILYHFSFIALKRQGGKRKYKLHESKYSDREKIASSTEEKAQRRIIVCFLKIYIPIIL